MQKQLIWYGLIGGAVYWWFFMRKPAVIPPAQNQLTTTANPQQMSPSVNAFPNPSRLNGSSDDPVDFYNIDAFPMGTFGG